MLRYSKTLSLALLISIPVIAMENSKQELVQTCQTAQEAAKSQQFVVQHEVTDLTATLCAQGSLEVQTHRLTEIEKQKQDILKAEEEARQAVNKALQNLLAKKTAKEQMRDGAKLLKADLSAQQLAHQNERGAKIKEFAAQAQAAIAKINANLQKEQEDYNKEADKKAKALTAQIEQAEKDEKDADEALVQIAKTIEESKKETPKKSGRWYLLGY